MTVAYFRCAAGASGDMFLGAWLDLGVPQEPWRQMLEGLSVHEYELVIESVKKQGIASTKVNVNTGHSHHHRHLPDIEHIIEQSDLPTIVKKKSLEAFHHLAVAEAKVHGTTPERIHFHEVGAVDAIVDIVGCMIAWHLAGEPECAVSPIEVGGGTVKCAHGIMPVPAPATANLLQGFPTYSSGEWGETTTPTGAAIIRTLAQVAPKRPFIGQQIGYGAGFKEFPVANVLRIELGEWADTTGAESSLPITKAIVVEANVDDMSPEMAGYVTERLLAQGAMDVAWLSIVMKKGRPAMQLQVLCGAEQQDHLQKEILRQTSTIGLRYYEVNKIELPREIYLISTVYGDVPIKVARLNRTVVNVAPEYEVCRQLAEDQGVPFKQVYQAALAQSVEFYDR